MKNLTIFRSPPGWKPELDKLEHKISVPGTLGYAWKDIREGNPYINVEGNICLVSELQKKLLPASVVNRELKIREEAEKQKLGVSRLGKRQLRDLKEAIINEMFVKAFITSKLTSVWIDTKNDLLCIETTSNSVADDIYKKLIQDLNYKGTRIKTVISPVNFMSRLLLNDDQAGLFSVGMDCAIQDEDGRSIKYKKEPLDTKEVKNHILNGKRPIKLSLTHDDKIEFTINENFVIGNISLIGIENEEAETAEEKFDNDFTLITYECAALISALVDAMGGENELLGF